MLRRSYKTMNFLHRLARRAWPARKAGEEQGAKFVSGLEEAFASSESVVVHAYRDVRETGEVDVEVEQARNGKAIIVRVIDKASAWSRASTAQAWGSDCRSS
jgi:hypothetical protein